MAHTLPFHKLVHHPTEDSLVLASGNTLTVLNTSTGKITAAAQSLLTSTSTVTHTFPSEDLPAAPVRCLAFHAPTNVLAVAADDKELACWDTREWRREHKRETIKRANCVVFSNDGKILIGDKFGDVYSFNREDPNGKEALILGHVSMLTDMAMSADGKHIITADRDEKIRVSQYPLSYEIETFCLGHRSFISHLHLLSFAPDVLLSGGGDPALLSWDFASGEIIQKIELGVSDEEAKTLAITSIQSHAETRKVAVLLESKPYVLLYNAQDPHNIELEVKLELPGEAMDIAFDRAGNVWVALGQSDAEGAKMVAVFRVGNGGQYTQNPEDPLVTDVNGLSLPKVDELPDLHPTSKLRKGLGIAWEHFHKKKKEDGGKGTGTKGKGKGKGKGNGDVEMGEAEAGGDGERKRKSEDGGVVGEEGGEAKRVKNER
ncbi:WD repeat-containing protein 4 [Rhizophlyctis rosea]|nr:WD repeat-containing protein 4 [Rhizophlyctis rosea]